MVTHGDLVLFAARVPLACTLWHLAGISQFGLHIHGCLLDLL